MWNSLSRVRRDRVGDDPLWRSPLGMADLAHPQTVRCNCYELDFIELGAALLEVFDWE